MVKCAPELLEKKVSTTGFSYRWFLEKLEKYNEEFLKTVDGNEVTKVF